MCCRPARPTRCGSRSNCREAAMKGWLAVGLLWWTAAAGAGAGAGAAALLDFTADERTRIAAHGPWPPPVERDPANRFDGDPRAIRFGRQLFFDRRLSADGQSSCASCHVPALAFQDGLAVAKGRSDTVRGNPRNTPGLLDVAQQRWFGWAGAHDMLWSASLAPLLAPAEMGGSVESLAVAVRSDRRMAKAYSHALGGVPPQDDELLVFNLAKALAAYQATLVSARTPFDAFRDALQRGDRRAAARYPLAAQRGLRLFIGHGRCTVCHAGARFSNGEFGDVGVPFFVPGGVDAGRHAGLAALLGTRLNRLGSYNDAGAADPRAVSTRHVFAQHRNFGEFRVPGLRQLRHTAPYMHDGSLARIEDVVRHYNLLNEERLHADGERILRPLHLNEQDAADLAAFLRSLSR